MLRLALLFLIIALTAGLFGFNVVANVSFGPAQILFYIFLALAGLFFVANFLQESPPRDTV